MATPDTVMTAQAVVTGPVMNCRAAQLVRGPEGAAAPIWATRVTFTTLPGAASSTFQTTGLVVTAAAGDEETYVRFAGRVSVKIAPTRLGCQLKLSKTWGEAEV